MPAADKAKIGDALTELRVALDPHMQRLKNLFAEWDANGDNKVSSQEFHKAMKVLALDAPKSTIDALFAAIDGAECDEVVAAQGRHTPLPMTNQLSAKTSTATSLTSD